MLMNGGILGSDAIIMDLEDAVALGEKDSARILVRNALASLDYSKVFVVVRINSIDGNGFWKLDLDEVVPLKPDMIMPTKVKSADCIASISRYIEEIEEKRDMKKGDIKLMPLIETAIGLENVFNIASADPRIAALLIGAEDLASSLHCVRTKQGNEILFARCRVLSAARAAGIDAYDTPFTDVNDEIGLECDARLAKSLGFSGKASISPRHIKIINRIFCPTQEEIDYANEVMEAMEEGTAQGKGAVSLHGKMVDSPVVIQARQILELQKAIKLGTKK
jgi:citrate lyase subunit beta/citryl-CoA lyase